jgi:hypothetical protein
MGRKVSRHDTEVSEVLRIDGLDIFDLDWLREGSTPTIRRFL